jgi:TatD DNase family protein
MSSNLEFRLVDSHCHLASEEFSLDLGEVISRARQAGVYIIVNVGYDPPSWEKVLAMAAARADLPCTVGLHPHEADSFSPEIADRLADLIRDRRVVAVGETGLDYVRMISSREDQMRAFRWHLELAAQVKKPVVIHNRGADEDIAMELVKLKGAVAPVLHCFSSTDPHFLEAMLELGAMVSFAGNVTYPSSGPIRDMIPMVPPDRLLIETDAPYLAPQAQRGKRNEPAFLTDTLQLVAKVLGQEPKIVADLVFRNALQTFGLRDNSGAQPVSH